MRYLTGDDTGRYGALPGQTNALRETRPSPQIHPMADLFAEIAADSTPVYGNYRSYEAAKNDFNAGDYGWGAVNALAALPGLGVVGAAGRGARRAGNAMAFRPAFKMRDGATFNAGTKGQWNITDALGGEAGGVIKNGKASIFGIRSSPYGSSEEVANSLKRRGFFRDTLQTLAANGAKSLRMNVQSTEMREIVKRLLETGELKNPRVVAGGIPTEFDINTGQ